MAKQEIDWGIKIRIKSKKQDSSRKEPLGPTKPRAGARGLCGGRRGLAFGELEARRAPGWPGFLRSSHAGVAGEEAASRMGRNSHPPAGGAGDAVAQGAGLAGDAAAFADGHDVEGARAFDGLEGAFDQQAQIGGGKILRRAAVDRRSGPLPWERRDAGDGGLAVRPVARYSISAFLVAMMFLRN